MRHPALLLLAVLITRAPELAAQPGPGLVPGRRVRVTALAVAVNRREATIESVRGDTLVLRPIVDS